MRSVNPMSNMNGNRGKLISLIDSYNDEIKKGEYYAYGALLIPELYKYRTRFENEFDKENLLSVIQLIDKVERGLLLDVGDIKNLLSKRKG